ncbi:hypothetical protein [Acinetobacter sp.]|uniref:hypothetical protein n=1 Tax=Acinetobacter sp. TaxID=472 RepID=UPI0035B11027
MIKIELRLTGGVFSAGTDFFNIYEMPAHKNKIHAAPSHLSEIKGFDGINPAEL